MTPEPYYTLNEVLEDAIWYALDAELGAPHSGVDMAIVVGDVINYLSHRGYEIVRAQTHQPDTEAHT